MTDPVSDSNPTRKWLWTALLVLVALAAMLWFAKPLGEDSEPESGKPQAQSTDWAPEPTGSAVPVTLPTTPLKNVPIEEREVEKEAE